MPTPPAFGRVLFAVLCVHVMLLGTIQTTVSFPVGSQLIS